MKRLLYFIFSVTFFGCQPKEEKAKPVNILMIAVDDLNSMLGILGHPNAITPNIDRLAEEGVIFTNAHCQAPLCGPSRVSVMTGLRPSTTGIYGMVKDDLIRKDNEVTDSITFLPEYFKQHGYHTMGIGKLFHDHAPTGLFDDSGTRYAQARPGHSFGPVPEKRFVWEGYAPDNPEEYGRTSTDWGAYPAYDSLMPDFHIAQWAKGRLAQDFGEQPFFMGVGFLRPHVPLYVPQPWFDLYPLDEITLPPYLPDDLKDVPAIARDKVAHLPMMPSTDWAIKQKEWRKIVQAYLACVSFVDAQIGEVIDALEQSPYADNTVIVLWSDHGYRLGEKGTFAKQALWEEATRAPLIFAGKGVPKGMIIDAPVELLSIYPTLLELANLPAYQSNEGISLKPLMDKIKSNEKYSAITTYGWNNHSIRTENYRYIRYEDGSEELYNHHDDPNEWTNLAMMPANDALKIKLRSQLPSVNAIWHKHSGYNFQPYFKEQRLRSRKGQ